MGLFGKSKLEKRVYDLEKRIQMICTHKLVKKWGRTLYGYEYYSCLNCGKELLTKGELDKNAKIEVCKLERVKE